MTELDVADPKTFASGHPFDLYDYWRTNDPVHRVEGGGAVPPYWVLTRHADISSVSRDPARFSNTGGFKLPTYGEARSQGAAVRAAMGSMLMTMDPPDHTELRRPLTQPFSAGGLRRLQEQIDEFVDDMIDGLRDRDEIELVSELTSIVPIRTLCLLLGIPASDERVIFDLTNRTVGAGDPEYSHSAADAVKAYIDMFNYGSSLIEERRRNPTDDVLGIVSRMSFHGAPLDDDTSRGMFTLLLAAGNETTRNSLTGGILALSKHRDQWELLKAQPELIPNAAQEIIRYVTPVIQMMRTVTTDDVEIDGRQIRRGEHVVLLYGAANRDPEVFDNPHDFDVTRENASRHLAFGVGPHYCLGGPMAAIQVASVLRRLLVAFPDLEVESEPDYLLSNFVSSIKRLTVSLTPVRA